MSADAGAKRIPIVLVDLEDLALLYWPVEDPRDVLIQYSLLEISFAKVEGYLPGNARDWAGLPWYRKGIERVVHLLAHICGGFFRVGIDAKTRDVVVRMQTHMHNLAAVDPVPPYCASSGISSVLVPAT